MSNILVATGSPRKGGNTELLMDEALRGAAEAGAETEKIFIDDLDIKPCKGCGACLRDEVEWCAQEDDMIDLYPKILLADGIMLGTPIYWWGPSAQLKLFFDRWYALMGKHRDKMKGKKTALICAMGDTNPKTARHTTGMFQDAFSYLSMPMSGEMVVTAHEKGEVSKNKEALDEAFALGKNMV